MASRKRRTCERSPLPHRVVQVLHLHLRLHSRFSHEIVGTVVTRSVRKESIRTSRFFCGKWADATVRKTLSGSPLPIACIPFLDGALTASVSDSALPDASDALMPVTTVKKERQVL